MDGLFRTFDIRMGDITIDDFTNPIHSLNISNDKRCALVSLTNNKIKMLERSTGETLNEFVGHKSENYSIDCTFTWDDSSIITGSEDSSVYVYDVLKGRPIY